MRCPLTTATRARDRRRIGAVHARRCGIAWKRSRGRTCSGPACKFNEVDRDAFHRAARPLVESVCEQEADLQKLYERLRALGLMRRATDGGIHD